MRTHIDLKSPTGEDHRTAREPLAGERVGITAEAAPGAVGVDAELDVLAPVRVAASLRVDHDELEALAGSVVKAIAEGDHEDVGATVGILQARVLEHLDREERNLFDGYAQYAPEDARELLRDHASIRKAVAEFDVGVDLHLLRADAVEAFLVRLQAHAARENAGLYCWAGKAVRSTIA